MEISVVVPAHDVERYLEQCVDSVLSQTFTDFELLLIDDASKDRTGDICDRYAQLDERVKVIHLIDQAGVSIARNTGVANAKGKYIAFIDSDDFVRKTYLENLYHTLVDYQADLVFSEFHRLDQEAGMFYFSVPKDLYGNVYEFNTEEASAMPEHLPFRHGCYVHPWGKLAKKEIYLRHPFIPETFYEDGPNSLRTFLESEKVVGVLIDDYTYRVNRKWAITNGPKIMKGEQDIIKCFRIRALDLVMSNVDTTSFRNEVLHNLYSDIPELERLGITNTEEYQEAKWLVKIAEEASAREGNSEVGSCQ